MAVEEIWLDGGRAATLGDLSESLYHHYRTRLGLMIVQRILRDHGGRIEIETRPGQGTTVTLLLPRFEKRVRLLESRTDAKGEEVRT